MRLYELADSLPEENFEHEVYRRLGDVAKFMAAVASSTLRTCHEAGLIDLASCQRMVDFGAGRGGPTFALAILAEENGGHVDAVEADKLQAKSITTTEMQQTMKVQLHVTDGVKWLRDRAKSGDRYDLITAFRLGPSITGDLSRDLILSARESLAPEGKLLIDSNPKTMNATQDVLDELLPEGYQEICGAFDMRSFVVPRFEV